MNRILADGSRQRREHVAVTPLVHTIPAACARLGGISRSTIYNMIKMGRVRTIEIGGRTMITDQECQRVVDAAQAAV
jgi:hypothetical protein